jgi:hypothetical protein
MTLVSPFREVVINKKSLCIAENVLIKEFHHQYTVDAKNIYFNFLLKMTSHIALISYNYTF